MIQLTKQYRKILKNTPIVILKIYLKETTQIEANKN